MRRLKIKLFADDVKLYVEIVNDIHVEQSIDALVTCSWATEWQRSISLCQTVNNVVCSMLLELSTVR